MPCVWSRCGCMEKVRPPVLVRLQWQQQVAGTAAQTRFQLSQQPGLAVMLCTVHTQRKPTHSSSTEAMAECILFYALSLEEMNL
ncbi:hypothetical protein BTVI_54540 [Pitangus sulphuratus]|nr:hypothetical protein BTVI_54540 [Pitangus sulphuratus]